MLQLCIDVFGDLFASSPDDVRSSCSIGFEVILVNDQLVV